MDGEIRTGPGVPPERQGTPHSGSHADGGFCSPSLPVGALSWLAGSFIVGCLVGGASGYGWLGTLITGWVTATAIGVALAIRASHERYCDRKTWWLEQDQ